MKSEHEITLFHTMVLIEMFCSWYTFFLWPYMVCVVVFLTQDDADQLECVVGVFPKCFHWIQRIQY